MQYVRNTWYAAGWSEEIAREPVARTFLDTPLVFFRKLDGSVCAMSDLCPHRFVPLSLGRIVDDTIECLYHGLAFDCAGECVANPHGTGVIPKAARLRTYPVAEAYGIVWIWMGDAARADPATIPDYHWMTDDRYACIKGSLTIEANYLLVMDNLTDLSHAGFVHANTLEPREIAQASYDISEANGQVWTKQFVPLMELPPPFKAMGLEGRKDHWLEMRCDPPGCMITFFGVTDHGKPRDQGWASFSSNLITPVNARTTHYMWAIVRDFAVGDAAVEAMLQAQANYAFEQEDKPIIEAQQKVLGDRDLMEMSPVLLRNDAGSGRARRLVQRMLDAERTADGEKERVAA